MKKLIPLFFVVMVLVLTTGGCARSTLVSTELPPLTEAPADPPPTKVPTEPPAPTEPPSPTATMAPTEPPTPTEPPPTEISVRPPANASLGDTWTRPADEMVMVYVPEGEFEMGSTDRHEDEQPVHTVALDGFWIDRTEVTNAQYLRCVEAEACQAPGFMNIEFKDPAKTDHPKVSTDWSGAEAYCEWAGAQLLTEAGWEYAARGPESLKYPWGDSAPDDSLLNYDEDVHDTTEVGSFPDGVSWCGALDMAGNAAEWVADWYAEDYYESSPARNPTGPTSGERRVMRGGDWQYTLSCVYSANRGWCYGGMVSSGGFRCARDAD